uniref:Zf-CCHC domain-containing protein/UBN2 domain-containing protein n=1 Tax=Tanacetum cinerariifolium TaxID=118510 RepID=A0A6L2KUA0_TANCI|nr:zf-CCHC domain-containing protein/UBN2 domain-containing protein [Tanacetum cinerariifolium]
MAQENYVEGCSMKKPPLLKPNRAKVTAIEEAKDLATLPLDEIIRNLEVYEMVLDNDGVGSKTTKEKVKSLALKAKVTRDQTSNDSDSQWVIGSNTKIVLLVVVIDLEKAIIIALGTKVVKALSQRRIVTIFSIEGHFASECRKPKENMAFIGGA